MVIGPNKTELKASSEFLEKESLILNLLMSFLSVFNKDKSKASKRERIIGEREDFEDILYSEYAELDGDQDTKNILDTVFTMDIQQINSTNFL